MDKKNRINLSDIFSNNKKSNESIDNNTSSENIFKIEYSSFDLLDLIINSLNCDDYHSYIHEEVSNKFKYVNYHDVSVFLDDIFTFIDNECKEYRFNQHKSDMASNDNLIEICNRQMSIVDDLYKTLCDDLGRYIV